MGASTEPFVRCVIIGIFAKPVEVENGKVVICRVVDRQQPALPLKIRSIRLKAYFAVCEELALLFAEPVAFRVNRCRLIPCRRLLIQRKPRLDRYLVVRENRVLVAQVRRSGAPLLSCEPPPRLRVAGLNLAGGVAVKRPRRGVYVRIAKSLRISFTTGNFVVPSGYLPAIFRTAYEFVEPPVVLVRGNRVALKLSPQLAFKFAVSNSLKIGVSGHSGRVERALIILGTEAPVIRARAASESLRLLYGVLNLVDNCVLSLASQTLVKNDYVAPGVEIAAASTQVLKAQPDVFEPRILLEELAVPDVLREQM